MEVEESDTIANLKMTIQKVEGFLPERQRLSLKKQVLQAEKTLIAYSIERE